ncbi:hypothetical protein GCM10023191_090480 [Actinoallomurus oryzae]|uniref:Uncharacterized protein n=1 Tax=Actinoallomurus oryzae TaxID=502180 RepID=A0ABP8R443_9ACTN
MVDDDKRAAIPARRARGASIRTIAAGVKVSIGFGRVAGHRHVRGGCGRRQLPRMFRAQWHQRAEAGTPLHPMTRARNPHAAAFPLISTL